MDSCKKPIYNMGINFMSTKTLLEPDQDEKPTFTDKLSRRAISSVLPHGSHRAAGQIQKVWCAPMTEAGEWVITWTRVPGALAYEVQTSLDGSEWSSGSKFSDTRAVLLIGPAPRCWARVRTIGAGKPGPWSEPAPGEKVERFQVAA